MAPCAARPLRLLAGPLLVGAVSVLAAGTADVRAVAQAKPDKNSVELVVRGCLKGRELTAESISENASLPSFSEAVFRLSGKGDLDKAIKQANGRLVEVTGLVKKNALAEPGLRLGGGRIVIGGGPVSRDPTRNPARTPSVRIFPMQVTAIALEQDPCAPGEA
ncbi:MAG: hypothetical protein ACT4QD_01725 [Acidobacteriota bacterium]